MLLAGIGQVDQRNKRNFLVVDSSKRSRFKTLHVCLTTTSRDQCVGH